MSKKLSLLLVCFALLSVGAVQVLALDLRAEPVEHPNPGPLDRATDLFQGDLGAEIGIGCSNQSGTIGGPNHLAVSVTSPLAVPFSITSHYYNIFTGVSPTLTALTFAAWGAGSVPPEPPVAVQTGLDFSNGDHTVAISPLIFIESSQFFFGQVQPQTSAGYLWGVDTSSGGNGTSFIKAPTCDVSEWVTLTSVGFSGNWVMSVSVEDVVVPVELSSWGEIKTVWQ